MSTPHHHHHHHHHHQHAASSASAPDPSDEEERQRLAALWVPSATGVAGSPPKPHRHIHIDWPNASIKKTLSIGASAPDASPPIYDRPLAQNESSTASSCVLITKSSPINATVFVSPEPSPSPTEAQKPVLISAKTGSVGSINLTIPSYTGARPLSIKAKSYNGNITIYLPSSFGGMLKWSSETGTLKISKAMQQRFKALDNPQHKHRGTAKISPSTASGLRGDVCEIANHHGSITVKDVDEAASSSDDGGKSCVIQ